MPPRKGEKMNISSIYGELIKYVKENDISENELKIIMNVTDNELKNRFNKKEKMMPRTEWTLEQVFDFCDYVRDLSFFKALGALNDVSSDTDYIKKKSFQHQLKNVIKSELISRNINLDIVADTVGMTVDELTEAILSEKPLNLNEIHSLCWFLDIGYHDGGELVYVCRPNLGSINDTVKRFAGNNPNKITEEAARQALSIVDADRKKTPHGYEEDEYKYYIEEETRKAVNRIKDHIYGKYTYKLSDLPEVLNICGVDVYGLFEAYTGKNINCYKH